jgi:hypothetical protein
MPTDSYFQQLRTVADGYLEEGRSGERLYKQMTHGMESLTSTAEVLAVLKAAGVPSTDHAVRNAAFALMHQIEKGRDEPERAARHVSYTMLGLTEYSQLRTVAAVEGCLKRCRDELARGAIQSGQHVVWSWALDPGSRAEPSILQTATAITALERFDSADPLLSGARDGLLSLASHKEPPVWPFSLQNRKRCLAKTAQAALALLGGTEGQAAVARTTCDWLFARHDDWETKHEDDDEVEGARDWRHFTFSLCLRACLEAGITSPIAPAYRACIGYIDSLWSAEHGGWREPNTRTQTTVRCNLAAVLAWEAVRNALHSMDPALVLQATWAHLPARRAVIVGADLELRAGNSVRVSLPDRDATTIPLSGASWSALNALARVAAGRDRASRPDVNRAYGSEPNSGACYKALQRAADQLKPHIPGLDRLVTLTKDEYTILVARLRAKDAGRPADAPDSE